MLTIRPFQPADAPVITQLLIRTARKACARSYPCAELEDWLATRSPELFVQAAAAGEHHLIAERFGHVVGFASWQTDELVALFVDSFRLRQGIGKALFAACETEAAGHGHRLTQVKSLRNATSYYEALGFKAEGSHPTLKNGLPLEQIIMRRAA